ncbi:MAG: acylphosphatase [Cenarchaeum sp. SB0678_bin_8]|nr:acylphosphatase [Cenarchaeum sp. SB0678_bin_8]
MKKATIRIHGTVQGVGLRVKIKTVADNLGVSGTVQNMKDGSVLVVCEAEEATIQDMFNQIHTNSEPATITNMKTEYSPVTGMEEFEILYEDTNIEMLTAIRVGTIVLHGVSKTLVRVDHKLDKIDNKLGNMDNKLDKIDNKLGNMDEKLGDIEHTQGEMLQTQKSMCSAIESINSKMDRSLKNDEELLRIKEQLR